MVGTPSGAKDGNILKKHSAADGEVWELLSDLASDSTVLQCASGIAQLRSVVLLHQSKRPDIHNQRGNGVHPATALADPVDGRVQLVGAIGSHVLIT